MVPGIGTGKSPKVIRFKIESNAFCPSGSYNVFVEKDKTNTGFHHGNPVGRVYSDAIFHNNSRGLTYGKRNVTDVFRNITHAIRTYVEGALKATAAARWLGPLLDIEGRQD